MTAVAPTEHITVTAPKLPAPKSDFWDGPELGFTDVLAAINPLQHLPIIGMIYRAVTGDTIGNVARVAGDGLYGGLIGLATGLANVALLEVTGKDFGEHLIATFDGLVDELSPSKPKPAAPATPAPAAVPPAAAAAANRDPPKLPLLGSATTAGELAAAAPISPLLAPRLAAQALAQQASPAPGAIRPLAAGPPRGIAIDVTDQGIARMRALSAAHNPQPVALTLPPGAFAAAMAKPDAPAQPDFSDRMREGLAKYDALMAARARSPGPGSVDQLH